MVILTVKRDLTRQQIMAIMPSEIRETVKLYLDGKIRQWYSRGDGKGVIFLLDAKTQDEASGPQATITQPPARVHHERHAPDRLARRDRTVRRRRAMPHVDPDVAARAYVHKAIVHCVRRPRQFSKGPRAGPPRR